MSTLHLVKPTLRAAAARVDALDPLAREARETLEEQAAQLSAMASRVDRSFGLAVQILAETRGHVVVCGIGKSGHIGTKLAATLASTGTPSFFVHAAEAHHGDLGKIREHDCVILISYSGETDEIVRLVPHLKGRAVPMIALVGNMGSTLAKEVDVALDVSVSREVCPNNLAPTSSTLATLAMGDALAVSLIRMRDFRPQDFAQFHPGGALGRRLSTRVRDAMRAENLPILPVEATLGECFLAAARGRLGLVMVTDGKGLCGVVCESALDAALERHGSDLSIPVVDVMRRDPPIVDPSTRLAEAERRMNERDLNYLIVVEGKEVVGVLERVRG